MTSLSGMGDVVQPLGKIKESRQCQHDAGGAAFELVQVLTEETPSYFYDLYDHLGIYRE